MDTPGVRSFGLGHVDEEDVLGVFPEVAEATSWCLPLCSHAEGEPSCAIDAWVRGEAPFEAVCHEDSARRNAMALSARRLLDAVNAAKQASRDAR